MSVNLDTLTHPLAYQPRKRDGETSEADCTQRRAGGCNLCNAVDRDRREYASRVGFALTRLYTETSR